MKQTIYGLDSFRTEILRIKKILTGPMRDLVPLRPPWSFLKNNKNGEVSEIKPNALGFSFDFQPKCFFFFTRYLNELTESVL